MATPKKEKLQVVEKSTDEVKIIPQNSSTQVMFDDVPVKGGGTKTVIFPGINDGEGILLGIGQSVAVKIEKEDWENIIRMHGKERAFNSYNGMPPCIMLIDDPKAIHNSRDVKAQKHGLEPLDPTLLKVEEVKKK